jgi:hypothetical protein
MSIFDGAPSLVLAQNERRASNRLARRSLRLHPFPAIRHLPTYRSALLLC